MKVYWMAAIALAGALPLASPADAAVVYAGNFCEEIFFTGGANVLKLEHQVIVNGPSDELAFLTCPMPNTRNLTGGLSAGAARVRVSNLNSYCAIGAWTEFGSLLSSQTTMATAINTPIAINAYAGVNTSAQYGSFSMWCGLHGGSFLTSYRYNER